MRYINGSEAVTGYRVKMITRDAFTVAGYTRIIPANADEQVDWFWKELAADGRLEKLRAAASSPPYILGLGTWDAECEKKGFRYTVCIEETGETDLRSLDAVGPLFRMQVGASEWMCFEMSEEKFHRQLWIDDPYRMLKQLGYRFYAGAPNLGVHFDVYPPNYHPVENPVMEFWITVAPSRMRKPVE